MITIRKIHNNWYGINIMLKSIVALFYHPLQACELATGTVSIRHEEVDLSNCRHMPARLPAAAGNHTKLYLKGK